MKARRWYSEQPWLVGCNYIPATAINQLEMWQADTFDAARIDFELDHAEKLGMNTMRVFLHDLLWQQDSEGYKRRISEFLEIAAKHHIKPMFVLFDSCWNPNPALGKQPEEQAAHNSGWVQSPGEEALQNLDKHKKRLEEYVKGVVGTFASDDRILLWDIWNEPENLNMLNDPARVTSKSLADATELLPQAFKWAREAGAKQPLTSGICNETDWSTDDNLTPIEKIQLGNSDIISFHSYAPPDVFEKQVRWLQRFNRPILCTEYMARSQGSTFEGILPKAESLGVAAINWGLFKGKTRTDLPWAHLVNSKTGNAPWFHDIFHKDGTPYLEEEVQFIRGFIEKVRQKEAEGMDVVRKWANPAKGAIGFEM